MDLTPQVPAAPGKRSDQEAQPDGNTDGLIGMVTHHFVGGFGTLTRLLPGALGDELEVINQAIGGEAVSFVTGAA